MNRINDISLLIMVHEHFGYQIASSIRLSETAQLLNFGEKNE